MPLIVLTGRADELDRVRGFERGGDDLSRSRSPTRSCGPAAALLRRTHERPRPRAAAVGELEIDPAAAEVRLRGRRVDLSRRSSRCCAR